MAKKHQALLREIEAFLAETGMGQSYFGKQSSGNSELVYRLRNGGRVWPETEARVRSFMVEARKRIRSSRHVNASPRTSTSRPKPAQNDRIGGDA